MRHLCCLFLLVAWAAAEDGLILHHDGTATACPLERTSITVVISGSVARVDLVQTFRNPLAVPAEAVYAYPLSHRGAVDRFSLRAGERLIRGVALERSRAEALYQEAVETGKTAALLVQRRPNVFEQRVGNLPPGGTVEVRVGYTELLSPAAGVWRFHVPTVVGPRYRSPSAGAAVDDPSPAAITAGDAGHRLNVTLELHTPVPHHHLEFPGFGEHIALERIAPGHSRMVLDEVRADRDLVCRWRGDAQEPVAGALVDRDQAGAVLALTVEPPQWRASMVERVPTDWVLLLDISGSMNGRPHELAVATIERLLRGLDPGSDRLQLTTFSGSARSLFDQPRAATPEHAAAVLDAVRAREGGGGGTEMLQGFRAALDNGATPDRRRVVVLLSDGYIGDEHAIHALVAEAAGRGSTFIGIGIGSSVNRHLFDGIGELGNGLSVVVALEDDPAAALHGLLPQISAPMLRDITIDWGTVRPRTLARPLPSRLYPGSPLHLLATIEDLGDGAITLSATDSEGVAMRIPVQLQVGEHPGLRPAWARERIAEIEREELRQRFTREEADAEILALALEHQLMSRVTSFVAVDVEQLPPEQRRSMRRLEVPVQLPAGMSLPRAAAVVKAEVGGAGAFMAIGAGGGAAGVLGSRRAGGAKRSLARRSAESALAAGLRFLSRHQSPDGRWDVDAYAAACTLPGPKCEPGTWRTGEDGDVLITAEALLAFLGSGYDHRSPNRWRKVILGGIDWLRARQGEDGAVSDHFDSHCRATCALAEAYAMTNDPALRPVVERAVERILRAQDASGGWRDRAPEDELGSTLFAVWALKSAKIAGIDTGTGLTDARAWLLARDPAADEQTAAWLLAGLLGQRAGDELADRFAGALLPPVVDDAVVAEDPRSPQSLWPQRPTGLLLRHWACRLYVSRTVGPSAFDAWSRAAEAVVTAAQVQDEGCAAGSWAPRSAGDRSEADRIGRILVTARAIAVLQLQSTR